MSDKAICGATKSNGEICKAVAGYGTPNDFGRCKFHGGASRNGQKFAARQAVMAMADETDAEPNEVLLKAIRCYWGAVQWVQLQASEANEQFIDAESIEDKEFAVKRLALWQDQYKGWVDQAARHSKLALDAGVAERQVRIVEMQAQLLAQVIRGILGGLGLTPEQQAKAPELVRTHMLAIDAQLASQVENEDDWGFEHPETPTVWDDDPNPIIGEILDHRGEVLCFVRMEPERRMGY